MKTDEKVVVDREAVQPAPSVLPPLPQRIIKRDGAEVPFDARRITVALAKAGRATGDFGEDEAQLLQQLIDAGVMVSGFVREPGSLESVFMQLTDQEEERSVLSYEAESGL